MRLENVLLLGMVAGVLLGTAPLDARSATVAGGVETIIAIRHGELQHGGLGQLSCKGLNRALALPKLLIDRYGAPDLILAPNPSVRMHEGDQGKTYSYVRPLATVEPLAIKLGLPVETQIGFNNIRQLQQEVLSPPNVNSTILIAWEHLMLQRFAQNLLAEEGADPSVIPEWKGNDFDSIYVIRIDSTEGKPKVSFSLEHEDLNSLSSECPVP